jgi:hypothetical protein
MKIKLILASLAFAVGAMTAVSAQSATIVVDAKDDIFLAGQSSVPTNFAYNSGAGGLGAGLLPASIAVHAGETLDITATGTASCCLGGSPTNGPDGGGLGGAASISAYGDVGAFNNPVQFPLVGVFGGPTLTTPWSIFVIGSSDLGVVVPTGATTLYLGLPDALGFNNPPGYYNDNTGSFTVSIGGVPEPSTWAMMLVGVGLMGVALRASRRQRAVVSPV